MAYEPTFTAEVLERTTAVNEAQETLAQSPESADELLEEIEADSKEPIMPVTRPEWMNETPTDEPLQTNAWVGCGRHQLHTRFPGCGGRVHRPNEMGVLRPRPAMDRRRVHSQLSGSSSSAFRLVMPSWTTYTNKSPLMIPYEEIRRNRLPGRQTHEKLRSFSRNWSSG